MNSRKVYGLASDDPDLQRLMASRRPKSTAPAAPIAVDRAFLSGEKAKAASRAARFAREAAAPPPPLPKKRIAWAGGTITSNRAEAVAKYIDRKELDGVEARAVRQSLKFKSRAVVAESPPSSPSSASSPSKAAPSKAAPSKAAGPPFAGLVFALSAGGAGTSQQQLTSLITKGGGSVSACRLERIRCSVARVEL